MIDTVRGSVRVRKWPRKRGKNLHPHTRYMMRWFKDACRKLRYVNAQDMDFAIKATKGTGLYPRDLLMIGMTEGLIDLYDETGREIKLKRQGIYPVSFQGIRLQRTSNFAVAASVPTDIPWPVPVIDTVGMWDPLAPTRIAIPAGVNIVRLTGSIRATVSTPILANLYIVQTGGSTIVEQNINVAQWCGVALDSGPIPVIAGDSFRLGCVLSSARSLGFSKCTNFCCEILDADYPTQP